MIVFAAPFPMIVSAPLLSVMSRSPVAAAFSLAPAIVNLIGVPFRLLLKRIVSAPARALASCTAARSVHVPAAVAQRPSPGSASTASSALLTRRLVGRTLKMAPVDVLVVTVNEHVEARLLDAHAP